MKREVRKQRKTEEPDMEKTITVKWKRSVIGRPKDQRETIRGLGFKRLNQTVTLPDRPQIRGMISHVEHLLEVVDGSERKPG
jgi:large subunit ribosomal protein L30